MVEKTMDKIVALAKTRGFVYPGSEIYGGLANTWDYGNLGVELKNNVKRAWWQKFIQESPYNVGVDCAILMNPHTWIASGHLGGFSDPLMEMCIRDREKIPVLSPEDISREIAPICNEEKELDGIKMIHHNVETNGIGYITLMFDLSGVPEEKLVYAGLLQACLLYTSRCV